MLEIYDQGKLEKVSKLDQVRQCLHIGRVAYINLARLLYEIKSTGDFRAENETFDEFCTENQIGQRQAKRLIDVWKLFAVKLNLPLVDLEQCDYSKLETIAPIVKDLPAEEIAEWIEKVKLLPRLALEQEIAQRKNGVEENDHEHQPITVIYCKACKRVITDEIHEDYTGSAMPLEAPNLTTETS